VHNIINLRASEILTSLG